jgi:hypothetical protein
VCCLPSYLSAALGFTWWSLGITIAAALILGYVLHLGDHILEVPISAMLILSVGTRAAADRRIIETLIGAGAGLLSGLIFARPRVQSAEEAMDDLSRRTAELLDLMAEGLHAGVVLEPSADWLAKSRSLGRDIRRVDDALRQAEESVRLNPRRAMLPPAEVDLRTALETLEHAVITVRGLARSLADSARLAEDASPVRDEEIRNRLAALLEELAAAVRTYGQLARVHGPPGHGRLLAELHHRLAEARNRQDWLSELLGSDPAVRPVGWPLRGELVSHLDRLRTELEVGSVRAERSPPPTRSRRSIRSWRSVRSWRPGWQPGRRRRPGRPGTHSP